MKKHSQTPSVIQTSGSNKIKFFLVVALVFLAGFLLFKISTKDQTEKFKNKIIPEAVKKVMGENKAKVVVEDVKETNGVIQFDLKLTSNGNEQKYTSYITKDGEILFTSGIKLDSLLAAQSSAQSQTKKLTCADLSKSEKANLIAFVVSQCPYGIQMQRVFKKAIEELSQLSSYLSIKYIGSVDNNKITSMHGDEEAQENLKQICIREEQQDKYWPYVSCYMKEGKGGECLTTVTVDAAKLKACAEDVSRGIKYGKADFDLANKFSVGGSPTLLLNEKQTVSEFDFGGRTADAIKQIVCCGSTSQPDFCQKEISKENLAPSFSKEDVASGSTSSSSGCGN
jgi:protein-disulfide isomerase